MRSPNYTTAVEPRRRPDAERLRSCRSILLRRYLLFALRLCISAGIFISTASAQRVAIIAPEKTSFGTVFSRDFRSKLATHLKVLDDDLAEAAFHSVASPTPFNLSVDEAKRIGSAVGCDAFIILRAETQRRSSSERNTYYETAAPLYVVSTRTGHLIFWKLQRFEADSAAKTEQRMFDSAQFLAAEVAERIATALKREITEPDRPAIEEVPDADSPEVKNFRAPIPYRRIKPEYTTEAGLYDVKATVDILVDTDAAGTITRTEIVQWAGYGLDDSVERAVRQMNWRPAERNGKPLPMRFLLRYNFKKLT